MSDAEQQDTEPDSTTGQTASERANTRSARPDLVPLNHDIDRLTRRSKAMSQTNSGASGAVPTLLTDATSRYGIAFTPEAIETSISQLSDQQALNTALNMIMSAKKPQDSSPRRVLKSVIALISATNSAALFCTEAAIRELIPSAKRGTMQLAWTNLLHSWTKAHDEAEPHVNLKDFFDANTLCQTDQMSQAVKAFLDIGFSPSTGIAGTVRQLQAYRTHANLCVRPPLDRFAVSTRVRDVLLANNVNQGSDPFFNTQPSIEELAEWLNALKLPTAKGPTSGKHRYCRRCKKEHPHGQHLSGQKPQNGKEKGPDRKGNQPFKGSRPAVNAVNDESDEYDNGTSLPPPLLSSTTLEPPIHASPLANCLLTIPNLRIAM